MLWIRDRFDRAGLVTDHGPSVCAGESSANPHYEPSGERPRAIVDGDVLLIDLWATEPLGVYADQTWMGFVGTPTARAQEVWRAVSGPGALLVDGEVAGTWRYRRTERELTVTPFEGLTAARRKQAEAGARLVAAASGDEPPAVVWA